MPTGEVRHANLRLTNGEHEANFPITFVKDDVGLPLTKSCEPTTLRRKETTECTITATNTTADEVDVIIRDQLPRELLLRGRVDGATRLNARQLAFKGTIDGAIPPEVTVVEAKSPFGYLPLRRLGIEPLAGPGVDGLRRGGSGHWLCRPFLALGVPDLGGSRADRARQRVDVAHVHGGLVEGR